MREVPPGAHFGLPTTPGGWGCRTFVGLPQRHTTSNTILPQPPRPCPWVLDLSSGARQAPSNSTCAGNEPSASAVERMDRIVFASLSSDTRRRRSNSAPATLAVRQDPYSKMAASAPESASRSSAFFIHAVLRHIAVARIAAVIALAVVTFVHDINSGSTCISFELSIAHAVEGLTL